MSARLTFHDVHLSEAMEGVTATARDGVHTYKVFVAAEALCELGASADEASWLPTFARHHARIAQRVAQVYQTRPNAAACVVTFTPD